MFSHLAYILAYITYPKFVYLFNLPKPGLSYLGSLKKFKIKNVKMSPSIIFFRKKKKESLGAGERLQELRVQRSKQKNIQARNGQENKAPVVKRTSI